MLTVQSIHIKRLLTRVSPKLVLVAYLPAAAIINITITFNLIVAVILAVIVNLTIITAVN